MTYHHSAGAITPLANSYPKGWSQGEAELVMLLVDFTLYWVPVLLLVTMSLVLHTRRRPGRLLAASPVRKSRSVRKRIESLHESLREDGTHGRLQQESLIVRMTALNRWQVVRQWLFGAAILPSGIVVFGALGGWGGEVVPRAAAFGALTLSLSAGAAAVEVWSLRRADPYGDAVRRGVVALEALIPRHCMESRLGSARQARQDRRPGAYSPVDWTFRTTEALCASLERLACHAVRSSDQVARARREDEVRLFVRHLQEALERYRCAADAHAAARGTDDAHADKVDDTRRFLRSSLTSVLAHLCEDRLVLPPLRWEDLPEDRQAAETTHTRRRTIWHAIASAAALGALAALFNWASIPGEFTSPVVFALGGLASVLLPRARWPQ